MSGGTAHNMCGRRWGDKVEKGPGVPAPKRCPKCQKNYGSSSVPGGVGGVTESSGSWGDH